MRASGEPTRQSDERRERCDCSAFLWESTGPARLHGFLHHAPSCFERCYSFDLMPAPGTTEARERLATGYALDYMWSETMGRSEGDSKEQPLRLIAALLEQEHVPYALIGGVAVQIHTADPRTTLDIDLAVLTYADVPSDALRRAGFEHTGRHAHSDNWRAPGPGLITQRTAVQFSAEDVGVADAVRRATTIELGDGVRLRVASVADLVLLKLTAAEESNRRPSRREHDVADVLALLEEHPEVQSRELLIRIQAVRARLSASLGETIDK